MVAKGHDLPDVTVAAVVDADAPLQFAGFRSEERAFALIVQIAGRAGRRGEPARVFVQAHEPAARVVQLGARHAVEEFLEGELARRRAHDLPPFSHLVRIVVEGERADAVARCATGIADDLRRGGHRGARPGARPAAPPARAHARRDPPGGGEDVFGDAADSQYPRRVGGGAAPRRGARGGGCGPPGDLTCAR